MKYLDLLAYPAMYLIAYVLMGFINWNRDPETWSVGARVIWIIWGTLWGMALQCRLNQDIKCQRILTPSPGK